MERDPFDYKIFLDCGAPSLYSKLSKADGNSKAMFVKFEERKFDNFSYTETEEYAKYRDEYIAYIKKNENILECYSNLDVINNPKLTQRNQRYLEEHGVNPIPVWHLGTDTRYLEHIVRNYEYMAIGGLVPNPLKVLVPMLDDLFRKYLCDKNGFPLIKIHGFACTALPLMRRYPWHCMTEEDHEVLTKSGWKHLSELHKEEEILCFENGKNTWGKINDIFIYDVKNVEINHFQNRNFEAFVSDNHRWLTSNSKKRDTNFIFKKSSELNSQDCINRVGKNYEFLEEPVFTDEQIGLLAWFWTDGTINHRKNRYHKNSITIYQSVKANPEKCDIIRDLLIKSKEKYCESKPSCIGVISFELYGDIAEWILSYAIDKLLPKDLPYQLTKKQAEMFLNYSILADGTISGLKRIKGFEITVKRQIKKDNLEIIRILCLLLGIPTSIYGNNNSKLKGLRSSSVSHIYMHEVKKDKIMYTGRLWCVSVPSGAFYTRCKNHIYVTGNSVDSSTVRKLAMYGRVILPDYTKENPIKIYEVSSRTCMFDETKTGLFSLDEVPVGNWFSNLTKQQKRAFQVHGEKFGITVDELGHNVTKRTAWNYLMFAEMIHKCIPKYPWSVDTRETKGEDDYMKFYFAGVITRHEEMNFWEAINVPEVDDVKGTLRSFFYKNNSDFLIGIKKHEITRETKINGRQPSGTRGSNEHI